MFTELNLPIQMLSSVEIVRSYFNYYHQKRFNITKKHLGTMGIRSEVAGHIGRECPIILDSK